MHISGYLGWDEKTMKGRREWENKGFEGTSGFDGFVHYLDCGDSFMGMFMSQLVELCTLNTCTLLHINYTSGKLLRKTITIFTPMSNKFMKMFVKFSKQKAFLEKLWKRKIKAFLFLIFSANLILESELLRIKKQVTIQ